MKMRRAHRSFCQTRTSRNDPNKHGRKIMALALTLKQSRMIVQKTMSSTMLRPITSHEQILLRPRNVDLTATGLEEQAEASAGQTHDTTSHQEGDSA